MLVLTKSKILSCIIEKSPKDRINIEEPKNKHKFNYE
jgi:hypothetical protein